MAARYVRIIQLWIQDGEAAAFEAFEREAAQVMARHDGRIDCAIRLKAAPSAPFEMHVVSFPDEAAFEAYGADPERAALQNRRDSVIVQTAVIEGFEAGPYF